MKLKWQKLNENPVQVKELKPGDWFIEASKKNYEIPILNLYLRKSPTTIGLHEIFMFESLDHLEWKTVSDGLGIIKVEVEILAKVP